MMSQGICVRLFVYMLATCHAAAPTAFLQLGPPANATGATAEGVWMDSMMKSVEGALVEAHELEEELTIKPRDSSVYVTGSSLLREATIKAGLLRSAQHHLRHTLLKLDFEATGCRIVMLLNDPATSDASHLCIWHEDTLQLPESEESYGASDGASRAADAKMQQQQQQPNGADAFARLRASRPVQAWLSRDVAEAAFAARFYDGTASEGFFPTQWQWLTTRAPQRRHLAGTPSSQQNASSTNSSRGGGGGGSVFALEGLAASKTYVVFRGGALQRGKRLFDEILAPQARTIPGSVAAASLHDPVLNKLLWLVLWRSEKARDEGERMLASVLNVSNALAPMLAEPLGMEQYPDASIFWQASDARRESAGVQDTSESS